MATKITILNVISYGGFDANIDLKVHVPPRCSCCVPVLLYALVFLFLTKQMLPSLLQIMVISLTGVFFIIVAVALLSSLSPSP